MQTVIQGKEIETTYSVVTYQRDDGKFVAKPRLNADVKLVKWTDLFKIDGEVKFNSESNPFYCITINHYNTINISEDESVNVIGQVYRADINTLILHTDKVVLDTPINKDEAEIELETKLKEYNRATIESNEKMVAYCKLNNLDIETVDIDDLKKVLGLDYITIKSNFTDAIASFNSAYTATCNCIDSGRATISNSK